MRANISMYCRALISRGDATDNVVTAEESEDQPRRSKRTRPIPPTKGLAAPSAPSSPVKKKSRTTLTVQESSAAPEQLQRKPQTERRGRNAGTKATGAKLFYFISKYLYKNALLMPWRKSNQRLSDSLSQPKSDHSPPLIISITSRIPNKLGHQSVDRYSSYILLPEMFQCRPRQLNELG